MSPADSNLRSEEQLARGLRRHDEDAIAEIYARFGQTTLRFLIHTLRDRALAEDVQQQVFLEVWRRGENYDPSRGALLTWIMQIARSRAIDQLRKRVPEPVDPHGKLATEQGPELGSSVDELADRFQMAYYFERLPELEARVLRMRFVDELSQSVIAEKTGVPLGTVKSRMVSGLRRLREMIEQDGMSNG